MSYVLVLPEINKEQSEFRVTGPQDASYQEYNIIGKEGEYPTSLWAYVTALYGGHDLCNDIHIQT